MCSNNDSITSYIAAPTQPHNLNVIKKIQGQSFDMLSVQLDWDSSDAENLSIIYYVIVFPPISLPSMKSESSFITENTTVYISLLYNHEYNISIVANNCLGNSTATSITVNTGQSVAIMLMSNHPILKPLTDRSQFLIVG